MATPFIMVNGIMFGGLVSPKRGAIYEIGSSVSSKRGTVYRIGSSVQNIPRKSRVFPGKSHENHRFVVYIENPLK